MAENTKDIIGDFLYNLRLSRNITQEELARRAGCANNTVSRLESGLAFPQRGTVARILSALRAAKELTPQQKRFVRSYLNLPDGYSLDEPETMLPPLTMDVVRDRADVPTQVWINHTVSEIVNTVGRGRALELLLQMASANGITISEDRAS